MRLYCTLLACSLVYIVMADISLSQDIVELPKFVLPDNSISDVDRWITLSGQYNDRILTAVYWSLGLVASLVFVVIGFNWFTGQRAYDRDREAAAAVLNAQLESGLSALRENITEFQQSLRNELESKFAEHIQATENITAESRAMSESNFVDFSDRMSEYYSSNFDVLRKELESNISSIDSKLQASRDHTNSKFESFEKSFSMSISAFRRATRLELADLKARAWAPRTTAVPSNALTYFIEAAEVSLEISSSDVTGSYLKEILNVVHDANLTSFDIGRLGRLLDKCPGEHSPTIERIRSHISG